MDRAHPTRENSRCWRLPPQFRHPPHQMTCMPPILSGLPAQRSAPIHLNSGAKPARAHARSRTNISPRSRLNTIHLLVGTDGFGLAKLSWPARKVLMSTP